MKKVIFTFIFAVMALGLAAQDGRAVVDSGSVQLYPDDSGESFLINIPGLRIGFGKSKNPFQPEKPVHVNTTVSLKNEGRKPSLLVILPDFEFGFNYLLTPDYSIYPSGTKEFLELHTGKSIHFGWSPIAVKASFNRKNSLGIASGLTLVWRDYAFSDRKMTVAKENGMLTPVQIDGNFKKTKLTTFALRIPVLLTITETQSRVGVGLGGYVDFVTGGHTKYKSPKHKERGDYYVEPVQFGLQARMRYKQIGIFANYGLGDMFQKDRGPATRPLTIGFGWGF